MNNRELIERTRKEVQGILSSNEKKWQEPAKYSFHIPVEDNKETTKAVKTILDKIAQLELQDALTLVMDIMTQLEEKIPLNPNHSDKRIKEYSIQFAIIKNKLSSLIEKDSQTFYNVLIDNGKVIAAWQKLLASLENLLSYQKKLALSSEAVGLCYELHASQIALYGNFVITYRRAEINALALQTSDNALNLVPYPATNKDEQVTHAKREAIERIATLDPNETVPLVLWNLYQVRTLVINIQEKTENDTKLLETLELAIKILADAEQKQRVNGLMDLKSVLQSVSKEKILKDLKSVVEGIEKIKPRDNIRKYLEELVIIFAGLHYRFFHLHPKLSNGEIDYNSSADWRDAGFHKLVGLYRIHVGDLYLEVAKAMRGVITREFEQRATQLPVENALPVDSNDRVMLDPLAGKQISDESKLSQMQASLPSKKRLEGVNYQEEDGFIIVTTVVSKEKKSLAQDVFNTNKMIIDEKGMVASDDVIYRALLVDSNVTDEKIRTELEFTKLENCINKYNLTKHFENLGFVERDVESHFSQYVNNVSIFQLYKPRTHTEEANKKIKEIHETKDPKKRILLLISFRAYLIKFCSDDLLDKVNTILKKIYHTLLDSVKPIAQNTQQIDAQFELVPVSKQRLYTQPQMLFSSTLNESLLNASMLNTPTVSSPPTTQQGMK